MPGLLDSIDDPRDLRALPRSALPALARELRAFLLDSVSATGGHLASNLGTVELTIALHRTYDTPYDRLVWDVGHQAYPHKILTGRRAGMARLRKLGGISGFPRRCESPFDTFGTAHASTSISAAVGMAEAARLKREARRIVAVIGDGAMSGGMAYEALNHAGASGLDVAVVLNDNGMSISPAVGALAAHLAQRVASPAATARRAALGFAEGLPAGVARLAQRVDETMQGIVAPPTLFEALGLRYAGPVDGHDLDALLRALATLRDGRGPRLLHVVTKKGRGFGRAEADPVAYHGVSRFEPAAGLAAPAPSAPAYTQVFGDWMCDEAGRDPRVVAITPAMREGSGLTRFAREFPDRFHDVGIAEQHALTFAAGLACEGMRPVVAIYSTFLQRGYDQLIHDVCLQNLPVVFAIDRAGLVGADGATHHGVFDLAYLRCVPNVVVMAPSDALELRRMLATGLAHAGPSAIRYPRGAAQVPAAPEAVEPLAIGRARVLRHGRRVAILAFGAMVKAARAAGDALDATVVDMRFVKPLDEPCALELAATHDLVVTLEEHALAGGAGAAVAELFARERAAADLFSIGIADRFVDHGEPAELLSAAGLDASSVERAIRERLAALRPSPRRQRAPVLGERRRPDRPGRGFFRGAGD
jgi:1-deoxy-D-xylulose-5-phosphate synthase